MVSKNIAEHQQFQILHSHYQDECTHTLWSRSVLHKQQITVRTPLHCAVSTVSVQHVITLLQQSEGHFGCHPFVPVKLVPLTSPHLQLLVITISENESLKQTRKRCQSCVSAQLHKLMLCSEDAVKNSFAPLFALLDQDEHLQEEEQRWRASKKDRFIYFRNTRSPAAPTLYLGLMSNYLFYIHQLDSSLYSGTDYLCTRWHQAGLYIVPLM